MRVAIHTLFAVLVAFLLVLPGSMSALGGGTPKTTELSATFRDDPGDMIHSDGLGAYTSNQTTKSYPNNVLLSDSGSLYLRIQKNRQVRFDFYNEIRFDLFDGQVRCREYVPAGVPPVYFYVAPPALSLPGEPTNDFAVIATGGSWKLSSDGSWYFDTTTFSFLSMTALNQVAYVSLIVRFDTVPDDETFTVVPGEEWLSGPGAAHGMVKVVYLGADSKGVRSWFLETLPQDDPLATYRGFESDQTALFMPVDSVKKLHGAGTCDLGDWAMPFRLLLTTR